MNQPIGHDLLILDIDGTLLDTPHETAWREAVETVAGADQRRLLTTEMYQTRIAGRPRDVGAAAALELVGIAATPGMVTKLATVKQEAFEGLAQGTKLFPDAVELLARAAATAAPVAVCTASKNAVALLLRCVDDEMGADWLRERIAPDGRTAPAASTPRTEMLARIGRARGVPPNRCLVIDDVVQGVQAASDIGMHGVHLDRVRHETPNRSAHPVLTSLQPIRFSPSPHATWTYTR